MALHHLKYYECEISLHIYINYCVIAHVHSYNTYTGTCTLNNADVHKELHKAPQYEGIAPHILKLGSRWWVKSLTAPTDLVAMLALQLAWTLWRQQVTWPCQKLNFGPLDDVNLVSVKSCLSRFHMKMCTALHRKCIGGGHTHTHTHSHNGKYFIWMKEQCLEVKWWKYKQ